jgi:hypothetical protein
MLGTLNATDLWGIPSSPYTPPLPGGAVGPSQNFVSPAFRGSGAQQGGSAPAISVLGLIGFLVIARVLIELGARTAD